MKKALIALLAIVTLASCTQPKIGVVNTEKLITEYQGTKDVDAELKAKQEKATQDIESLIKAFQVKVAAYQKAAAKMSKKVRAEKEQALGAEQQMIQKRQQELPYKLQNDNAEAIKKIAKTVNDFVKDYGKKNGYQTIFGTVNLNGAVMYNEAKVDLTDMLLKSLNDSYKKDSKGDTKPAAKKEMSSEEGC